MDKLYNVIGLDDHEGVTFARCTSLARAVIAKTKLEECGYEGMLDIVQDNIPVDTVDIDGTLVDLAKLAG